MLSGPGALSRRVERAGALVAAEYARRAAALHPEGGALTAPLGGGSLVFAGPGHPMSRATGLGLAGPVSAAELDELETFYFARAAAAIVDLCPYGHATLRELLAGRRYALTELENVWWRSLSVAEAPSRVSHGGVSTREVLEADGELWARTVLGGAFSPGELSPLDLDVFRPFPRMSGVSCFLATVDGQPAGGGCLALGEGTAALFTTSTLPAFRNRGVQSALLAARLEAATRAGCDLAYAVTEPGSVSERNVQRLGFSLLYTRPVLARGHSR